MVVVIHTPHAVNCFSNRMPYIGPSVMCLLAVLIYGEPFTAVQGWTFVMIWTALAIYSIDSVRTYRRLSSVV